MCQLRVAIRADASVTIGTGHIMRCLTLANTLSKHGAEVYFICRHLPDYLHQLIINDGHQVAVLKQTDTLPTDATLPYADWLGVSWQLDANETQHILTKQHKQWHWLIVDHYAIDKQWENVLLNTVDNIMVIDDLADRPHHCQLLLDQNLNRKKQDYQRLVPQHCQIFTGTDFTLLRPEFSEWRSYSLQRRTHPQLKNFLVTLGGTDEPNVTSTVIRCLQNTALSENTCLTVIMGAAAPGLGTVKKQLEDLPFQNRLLINIHNMAEVMANTDLIISAAGSTSWERCCLGVPGITIVLAENQQLIADALTARGASLNAGNAQESAFSERLKRTILTLVNDHSRLKKLSLQASTVTTGVGTQKISQQLTKRVAA